MSSGCLNRLVLLPLNFSQLVACFLLRPNRCSSSEETRLGSNAKLSGGALKFFASNLASSALIFAAALLKSGDNAGTAPRERKTVTAITTARIASKAMR